MSLLEGAAIRARLEALAAITETPPCLTRRVWTPEHRRANDLVAGWMRQAGLAVREDAVGNIIGRRAGFDPPLLLGSHLDSVRGAGMWDGPLGVVTALACVAEMPGDGRAVEVVGFADEEGTRFGAAMLGSRAMAGTFDPAALALADDDGVTMAEAMRRWGLPPERIAEAARPPGSIHAYLELHIEQGPVLERAGLPVGVVSAIAGATRLAVTVEGQAGHAGTVPMAGRRDALAAAAACVLAVERQAMGGGVATVGRLEVADAAVNTIPGRVTFSVDIRAAEDAARRHRVAAIRREFAAIAADRGVGLRVETTHELAATPCAARLRERLAASVAAEGLAVHELTSGAGHDGMALRGLCDIGMLFVRCRGGISHHPAEHVTDADAAAGARVLARVIRDLAAADHATPAALALTDPA